MDKIIKIFINLIRFIYIKRLIIILIMLSITIIIFCVESTSYDTLKINDDVDIIFIKYDVNKLNRTTRYVISTKNGNSYVEISFGVRKNYTVKYPICFDIIHEDWLVGISDDDFKRIKYLIENMDIEPYNLKNRPLEFYINMSAGFRYFLFFENKKYDFYSYGLLENTEEIDHNYHRFYSLLELSEILEKYFFSYS